MNGKLDTEELQPTDTVPDTRNLPTTTETSLTALDGSLKLIRKLDSSSTDSNPTGIAHHAHTPILDTQPLELLKTETLESSSTESSTGKHQPTSGKNGTEESLDTDTALATEELHTHSEPSNNAVTGLDKSSQESDSSSSESNPTGIAHHAQPDTEVELHTLLLITEPTSTSSSSETLDHHHGLEDGIESNKTDTAEDTRRRPSTTDLLMLVVDGLEELTQKPNTSCSDSQETSTAHHAQCTTMVQPLVLMETTQSCTSIESKDGEDQPTDGRNGIEELQSTDTVPDTRSQPSTTEALLLVPTGLETSIRKLDTSSIDINPTTTAHHAHTDIRDIQPLVPLMTRTQESSSTES
jgi:hypothetical protein